jgi:hypothetical protein
VGASDWVRYDSAVGRFSVLMPEIPKDTVETKESEHGPYTTYLFIARDERNVYLIGWVDYDAKFNFNRQSEMEANRDNFVKGVKATLTGSRSLTIDGYQVTRLHGRPPALSDRDRLSERGRDGCSRRQVFQLFQSQSIVRSNKHSHN